AYPELSCTRPGGQAGGPFAVEKGWGVFDDVFCTKDSTITFLQDVLDEVLALFPSPYIHMGGDECPHVRWEACPRCQAVMKREGLKNSGELQSYFVRRIERYLNGKGRKLIGWDEILEGGLAPNATVMSWRGTEGGIEAAKAGHPVVMTPGEFCYFDHYQGDPAQEPLAIGGFTPLQKVYAFEPTTGLSDSAAHYVLGAQANLWTEYIVNEGQVKYMVLPRMMALSEVLWSPKGPRDELAFIGRVRAQLPALRAARINYARSMDQVAITPKQGPRHGSITVEMRSGMPGSIERSCQCMPDPLPPGTPRSGMATNSPFSERCDAEARSKGLPCTARPAPYTGPIELTRSTQVRAVLRPTDGAPQEGIPGHIEGGTTGTFTFTKATARTVTLSAPPDERYDDGGAFTLVDGISGGLRRISTEWLGWRKNVTVTVDLDSVQSLTHVGIGSWHETYAWIHQPKQVAISTSVDGKVFTPLATVPAPAGSNGRVTYAVDKTATARYVRFAVQGISDIPAGLAGAGKPAWLFLDEIDIR
ncbi:MAG TPA: family 20 glycosylhydrolase, partial [Flavobacteriales bacterium]|nr:family 20 glycosylhydrolase [Flavobacteriales bacterium]